MVNVLQIFAGLVFFWTAIFLLFGGVFDDDILFSDVTTTGEFNETFTNDELDLEGGGFFGTLGAIGAIIGTVGRFFGLIFFGLTPALTGSLQVLFSTIITAINFFSIAVIVRLLLD